MCVPGGKTYYFIIHSGRSFNILLNMKYVEICNRRRGGGGGSGGTWVFFFTGHVSKTSQNPYPITDYSVANYRPLLLVIP